LALAMILTYWFYSFGENLEVLTYIAWPALLTIGIVLRMQERREPTAREAQTAKGADEGPPLLPRLSLADLACRLRLSGRLSGVRTPRAATPA
jgi:hypothetical protein